MLLIPFIYFIGLGLYFYNKQHCWNIDIAAVTLLVIISFFAIIIDIKDIYGMYGINDNYISLPTIVLFCVQWTIILLPIHYIAQLRLEQHLEIKKRMLLGIVFIITASSLVVITTSLSDIREALLMDMIDRYHEHLSNISEGSTTSNYLMFLPQIFVTTPFPTLALFLWFYLKAFTNCSIILRSCLLISSIVQAIISIIGAGRAAIIFWAFDFFMLYSYFYKYLSHKMKRNINITFGVFIILCGILFISITISRFDISGRNPLDSLYGYAGQHINNFCAIINKGGNSPFLIGREFPLIAKITGNPFNLLEHYETIASKLDIMVNVFDTFGAELYLDLGWFGYITFFIIWVIGYLILKIKWIEILTFRNVFIFIILITFFTRGIFSWPFTGHYTTFAIMLMFLNCYLFKYIIKI